MSRALQSVAYFSADMPKYWPGRHRLASSDSRCRQLPNLNKVYFLKVPHDAYPVLSTSYRPHKKSAVQPCPPKTNEFFQKKVSFFISFIPFYLVVLSQNVLLMSIAIKIIHHTRYLRLQPAVSSFICNYIKTLCFKPLCKNSGFFLQFNPADFYTGSLINNS